MPQIRWKELVGQDRIKEVLDSAFQKETLGHAYLLCGESGTGKFTAALELAMALLCTGTQEQPCYTCENCRKVLNYSHPDFHVIMPVALQKEHRTNVKLSSEGWEYLSEEVRRRIKNSYYPQKFTAIPTIPLEWVKEVNHAIMRGPLESRRNIAILDGIDLMQKESANAMLKTLEEPPSGSLILLLTERIHSVLPTIISRCQILRLSYVAPEQIRSNLASRFNIGTDDSRLDAVVNTGSLGKAMFLWDNPVQEVTADVVEFWKLCTAQNWADLAAMIDKLGEKGDFSVYENLFVQMIQLVRNAFFRRIRDTENYIMGDRTPDLDLGKICTPDQVEEVVRLCEKSIGQITAHANISLVLVNFAIDVMEILNGKK